MRAESGVECIADVRAVLGEGPVWVASEAALYWVDIKGWKIFRLDEAGERREYATPFRVGSLVPRASGGFIAGTDEGIAGIDLDAGRFTVLHNPEAHLPDNRFNDGKVDRSGRFCAGTMDDTEQHSTGTLYQVAADLNATPVDTGYKVTNGPAFSLSGDVMYHNDSARQATFAFDLDADGKASNRRLFASHGAGDGYPDGMTVDAEDCVWIAFWDGWCVRRFSPAGECIATLQVPVSKPTSCAFGGAGLDQLYITSASIGLDEQELAGQPQAGGLFVASPGVRGVAELPFAG
ncbi:MAG: SMP-30/gluconolactonase/LRE family protein [Sphingomonas sp.]|nr:SMP-30/gluconolactonase/LRE family protein [Sphingomonas sp.]